MKCQTPQTGTMPIWQWVRCGVTGIMAVVMGTGCAAYHGVPLSAAGTLKGPDRDAVRVAAGSFKHPMLRAVEFKRGDDGFSPEQAAIFAVLANPTLRAARDARGLAGAQIIAAGILPNPQVAASMDLAQGNSVPGVKDAYGLSATWEVTALFARSAKIESAREHAASVDLSVAWQEWQTAEAAKLAVYEAVSLERQVEVARDVESGLMQGADVMRTAVQRHEKTEADLAPAAAAADQAKSDRLTLEQASSDARLALNQLMGLPPNAHIKLRAATPDDEVERLIAEANRANYEETRLDLAALRMGYQSQEATLRAAVRGQFPKIVLGVTRASDNAELKSVGPNATLDLPIFDRNQGNIAIEKATRQQLYDEYNARVYDARAEIAKAGADLKYTAARAEAAAEAVPVLRKVSARYDAALTAGGVDVTLAYGARQALSSKQLEAEKLRGDVASLIVALELATGRTLLEGR